jgi:glycosyltransferase involved in cell wall biosynthesis
MLSVCETVKGGISTYLRLIEAEYDCELDHKIILPGTQAEELYADSELVSYSGDSRDARKMWNLYRTTKKTITEWKPDIVFFHSSFTLPILAMLKLTGSLKKNIYCAHGWGALSFETGTLKRKIVSVIEGNLTGLTDIVINISQSELDYARLQRYRGKHVMIENAVGVPAIPARGSSSQCYTLSKELNILFVGRFDKQKGLDILLDAFDLTVRERSDIQLHVVGGPVLAQDNNIRRNIKNTIFYGWLSQEELYKHYVEADLVVVPSRWEGFGLVVAESMRAGTPVLVSSNGSLPTLVVDRQTGYISELSVSSFSEVLMKLSKSRLLEMRDSCIETYNNRFSADRFKREFNTLCDTLLNRV